MIITIGRQYASGGRQIGELVAKKLDFAYFDKELITLAAKESGLSREFFEQADEKKRGGFFYSLFGFHSNIQLGGSDNLFLNSETLFKIQSDVIRQLAKQQNCVFVGRCADYILRDNPNSLNIFITANRAERRQRLVERGEKRNGETLDELLDKTDRSRAEYYNFFTNKHWGNSQSYHFCINSSLLGIEQSAELICEIVKKQF
ncbi:MAG: cytidylate kinase-like family protein [Paludibacter sp.]|jgi:cytidylate kinase|nr:cytidylate kinase-like family protein [Paludibacter sp.]